jgi:hypothetical protein
MVYRQPLKKMSTSNVSLGEQAKQNVRVTHHSLPKLKLTDAFENIRILGRTNEISFIGDSRHGVHVKQAQSAQSQLCHCVIHLLGNTVHVPQ